MRKPLAEINHPPSVNESVPPVESSENIAASTSAATTKEEPEDESGAQIITHIESEWRQEIVRITSTSAQARKKESLSDCLVKSAHAILEADTDLLAYGNALEVLDKVNEYPNVQKFVFKYVRYDFISRQQCLAKLKNFCSLTSVSLDSNNLTSFVQLSKFESLNMLKTINVYNNDVSQTVLLRSYIVYRFPNITTINDSPVNEEDRSHARQQFQNFDKTLCKSLYKTGDSGKKYADVSVDYVNSLIIPHAVRINDK